MQSLILNSNRIKIISKQTDPIEPDEISSSSDSVESETQLLPPTLKTSIVAVKSKPPAKVDLPEFLEKTPKKEKKRKISSLTPEDQQIKKKEKKSKKDRKNSTDMTVKRPHNPKQMIYRITMENYLQYLDQIEFDKHTDLTICEAYTRKYLSLKTFQNTMDRFVLSKIAPLTWLNLARWMKDWYTNILELSREVELYNQNRLDSRPSCPAHLPGLEYANLLMSCLDKLTAFLTADLLQDDSAKETVKIIRSLGEVTGDLVLSNDVVDIIEVRVQMENRNGNINDLRSQASNTFSKWYSIVNKDRKKPEKEKKIKQPQLIQGDSNFLASVSAPEKVEKKIKKKKELKKVKDVKPDAKKRKRKNSENEDVPIDAEQKQALSEAELAKPVVKNSPEITPVVESPIKFENGQVPTLNLSEKAPNPFDQDQLPDSPTKQPKSCLKSNISPNPKKAKRKITWIDEVADAPLIDIKYFEFIQDERENVFKLARAKEKNEFGIAKRSLNDGFMTKKPYVPYKIDAIDLSDNHKKSLKIITEENKRYEKDKGSLPEFFKEGETVRESSDLIHGRGFNPNHIVKVIPLDSKESLSVNVEDEEVKDLTPPPAIPNSGYQKFEEDRLLEKKTQPIEITSDPVERFSTNRMNEEPEPPPASSM